MQHRYRNTLTCYFQLTAKFRSGNTGFLVVNLVVKDTNLELVKYYSKQLMEAKSAIQLWKQATAMQMLAKVCKFQEYRMYA